jgi:hypothetical protein
MRSHRLAVLPLALSLAVAVAGCSDGAGETATADPSVVTSATAVTATTAEPTTTFAPTTTTAPPTTTEDAGDLSEFDYLDPATFPTVELVVRAPSLGRSESGCRLSGQVSR